MPDPVLAALTAACPAARPAAPEDAVAGVTPRYTASPATISQASALMRAAAEHDLAVVPRGGGSKLDWGVPPRRCDLVVGTGSLDQVTEHAAGDLVARVQAGVRIQHLAEVLAKAGQQLALDPPPNTPGNGTAGKGTAEKGTAEKGTAGNGAAGNGAAGNGTGLPDRPTIGGTLATAAAGPRRMRYGTPRDLVIGITVVRADGAVARSGGKVVKNVAGYDLGKLFAGSYGTLGLIVEAVFRLHPIPAGRAYVTNDCPDVAGAHRAVSEAVDSQLSPSAVEIDRPAHGQPMRVGVLLEGDPDGVQERAELMRGLIGPGARASPAAPAWWGWPAHANKRGTPTGNQRTARSAGSASGPALGAGTLIKIGFWAATFPAVVAAIDSAAAAAGLDPAVGGSAAAGVIYAAAGADADPAAIAKFVAALRGALADAEHGARPSAVPLLEGPPALASAVVVHSPPGVRGLVDPWGPAPSLGLMRAVKDQFDPEHRMAPGRFAGGL